MKRLHIVSILLILSLLFGVFGWSNTAFADDSTQSGDKAVYDRLIVHFKQGVDPDRQAQIHQKVGAQIQSTIPKLNAHVVKVPRGLFTAQASAYRTFSEVFSIEPDYILHTEETPNDSYFNQQWGMTKIQAPQSWNITHSNSSIKIAILDTGISLGHTDLAAKIVAQQNFSASSTADDLNGHGTHVAGIAAAITNNGIGVAGVAYDASLMDVKVLDDNGSGYDSSVAQGIIWAADHGANVINLSLGGSSASTTLQQAVDYAWDKGVVVVAAAGNNGSSTPIYPGYYTNCLSVAATDQNDKLYSFSDYGTWVDVAAPGSALSTVPNNGYGTMTGTSMATPFVSGLAGLVFSLAKDANSNGKLNDEVRSIIENNTDNVGITTLAHGRINAYKAVTNGSSVPATTITVTSPVSGASWAAGSTKTITWTGEGISDSFVKIELYKGSALSSTISSYTYVSTGTYSWPIPQTQAGGTDYSIKISTVYGSQTCSGTSSTFTITGPPPPKITVTSPVSGASWAAGSTKTVTWTGEGISDSFVKIELYKGSALSSTISFYTYVSTGTYNWPIPQTQAGGTDYSIKISTVYGSQTCSGASSTFTITGPPPPKITVTSPVSGASWAAGSTKTVTWTGEGISDSFVKIELYKGSALSSTISSYTYVSTGTYSWPIPQTQAGGTDYSIKISTVYGSQTCSGTSSTFTITGPPPPRITVTSPVSGASWAAGSTKTVTWTGEGISDSFVKIELYKGSALSSTISSYTYVSTGTYNWPIPQTQAGGTDYSIKISTVYGSQTCSGASSTFTITGPPPPKITVTSPVSGASWAAGSTKTITWTGEGISDSFVKIELYKGSALSSTISSYTYVSTGTYSWPIPQTQAGGTDYSIKISTVYGSQTCSGTSSTFTITGPPPPKITVTSPVSGASWAAGSTKTVTWTGEGISDSFVKIELYKGSALSSTISFYTYVSTGTYNWPIPQTQAGGTDYSIKISTVYGSQTCSGASSTFTITGPPPPKITVTSPVSGASWAAGSTKTVTWTGEGISDSFVKIELYKGSALSSTISSYTYVSTGTYSWPIPQTQAGGTDYSIKISTVYGSQTCSGTSSTFTITGPPPSGLTDEQIQNEAFNLINSARENAGLAPLTNDPNLVALCREHVLYMIQQNQLSHDGFNDRAARSGYGYVGENVAMGYRTAQTLVDAWLSSSGHRSNILNANFHFTGLVYINGWACQIFGGN